MIGIPLVIAAIIITVVTTTPASAVTVAQAEEFRAEAATDIAVLKRNVEILFYLMGILGALVLGGGVIGLVLTLRDERRAGRAFEVALAGEKAEQERAALVHSKFLDSSKDTLDLVNATLALAKEANQRAMKTQEDKAKLILRELTNESEGLLSDVYLNGDFKAIVENPQMSAKVQEIASRLASIEGYLQVLDIELTAPCLFVRGIDRHLKEEPTLAIKELERVAKMQSEGELALYANYWIGYECNNLGLHEKAADTFRRLTERFPNDVKTAELKRIEIESRFFHHALRYHDLPSRAEQERARIIEEVRGCEQELADLADSPSAQGIRTRILNTQANLVTWRAHTTGDTGLWRAAADLYEQAGDSLWPKFGYLEAMTNLGQPVDPDEYQWVVDTVMKKIAQRVEPRSKVLLFTTKLIAYCRQPHRTPGELDSAYSDVLQATGRVNPLMRVYSQFTKTNIPIEDSNEELRKFYRELATRP